MDNYIINLASSLAMQETHTKVAMSVLKRTNDMAETQGSALIQMMEQSAVPAPDRLLDVYA